MCTLGRCWVLSIVLFERLHFVLPAECKYLLYACHVPLDVLCNLLVSCVLFQDRVLLADNARANFFRPGGDHLTLLNVYNEVCVGGECIHWEGGMYMYIR